MHKSWKRRVDFVMIFNEAIVCFTLIFLFLATINDLYNKKVSNILIVAGCVFLLFLLFKFQALYKLQALSYALPIVLILHKMRAIGGGDCKVLLVMSPVVTLEAFFLLLLVSSGVFLIANGIKICIKKYQGVQVSANWLKSHEKFTYTLLFAYLAINLRPF